MFVNVFGDFVLRIVIHLVCHTEGKRRLRGFENRVLRKIFGPKRVGGKRGVESTTQ